MAPPSKLIQYPHLLSMILILAAAAAAASDHLTLQLQAAAASEEPQDEAQQVMMGRPGCRDRCGGMSIPFPFGMDKPGCFFPGFEVTCNTSFTPPRTFLANNYRGPPYEATYQCTFGTNTSDCKFRYNQPVEVFDISLDTSEVRVYGGVTSRCFTDETVGVEKGEYMELDRDGPFLLSPRDDLVGVGWSVKSSMSYQIKPYGDPLSCTSNSPFRVTAGDGSCSGLGCCQTALPPPWPTMPVLDTAVNLDADNYFWETNPCSYGMVVERSWYNFSEEDLSGYEVLSKKLTRGFPLVLDFAIRNGSCERDGCLSGNSSCAKAAYGAEGYVCKCVEHFHGNPYITNGCQDIDECQLREQSPEFRDLYPCDGICTNLPGGYDCRCKRGMKGDAKKGNCTETFPLPAKIVVEETTCTNEMSKETTSENICQKRPPTSGGTPGQATRGTCRLGQCRQAPAAVAKPGTSVSVRRRLAGGPCRFPRCRQDDVAPLPPMGAPAPCDPLADSRSAQVPMQKEKSWAGDSFAADSEAADCKL